MTKPKKYDLEVWMDDDATWYASYGHHPKEEFLEAVYNEFISPQQWHDGGVRDYTLEMFIAENLHNVEHGYFQYLYCEGGERAYFECEKGQPFAIPITSLPL